MPEIDLKNDATALLGQIAKMQYEPAPLEMQFMKGLVRKIDCPTCKVTEGNINYLKLILRRAEKGQVYG